MLIPEANPVSLRRQLFPREEIMARRMHAHGYIIPAEPAISSRLRTRSFVMRRTVGRRYAVVNPLWQESPKPNKRVGNF